MIVYRIDCEWEMPIAQGYFKTKKKAQEAINKEDWLSYIDMTLEDVQEGHYVSIEEIEVQ